MTMSEWQLSSSSDRTALDLVDGTGKWDGNGPHYSRRTPGSKTFTGVGQEVVLVHPSGAVWAVVRARVPSPRGSGSSRGRSGELVAGRYVWRCNMFRNLGPAQSSDLIRSAVIATVHGWVARYGVLPDETLQTEVKPAAIRSPIPGYSYRRAGWVKWRERGGLVILRCPRPQIERAMALPNPLPPSGEALLFDETTKASEPIRDALAMRSARAGKREDAS